ncbi:MAG: nitrite reductase large subunit, partial [Thermoleophilaceae bacterium]|nr:nitrite reductase large subunit [Thermoleophilaceae bacterium]
FAPFHWGAMHLEPGRRALNAITPNALDPTSKQAELKATAVRIEPSAPGGEDRRPGRSSREPRTLVVGAGMAGLRVVESLLDHGVGGASLTLVGEEGELPYDRVRLPRLLDPAAEASTVRLREPSWFDSHRVTVHAGARVDRIDLAGRRALLAGGGELGFDRLVLATGSRAALPPIPGLERGGVHAFRSLADARALAATAVSGAPAVVIGGGLLGLEAARGLQARGMRVTVVHLADRLMEQQLDPIAAGLLDRRMRELGIAVELNAQTTELAGNGRVEGVRLAGGRELEAALVVVATGIRPNVELARSAGLDVARGVVVDDEMRTSDGATWAVGDCAEHRGTVQGLVAPARRQAQVAAAVLAGRPAAFHGSVPATRLKVMGVELFCAGATAAAPGEDELLLLDSRNGRYRKLVIAGNRLAGAILVGDLSDAARLHRTVESGIAVPADLLAAGAAPAPASGDELVCSCNSVTRAAIARAVRTGGAGDAAGVAALTGASTGCGGCRSEVERIVAGIRDEPGELADVRAARAVGRS